MLQFSVSKRVLFKRVFYTGFTLFLASLVVLPFIAPILAHYGYKRLSNFIYEIYSFMCHQKAHRSLFIFDEQCAWCVRDTFIWTAMFITWLFVLKGKDFKPISWKVAVLFGLPMALDGGIQLVGTVMSIFNGYTPFYESTNTIRAITGTLFGVGVGLFLLGRMKNELENL
jgi:uncharacterized membrane protein